VLELARGEFILRRENVIALGDSGTGKTHVALGHGDRSAATIVLWFSFRMRRSCGSCKRPITFEGSFLSTMRRH
jgi:hypothetical protein